LKIKVAGAEKVEKRGRRGVGGRGGRESIKRSLKREELRRCVGI